MCYQCDRERLQNEREEYLRDAIQTLRTALTELVERRARAVKEVGGSPDGSDGRYARARAALDTTKDIYAPRARAALDTTKDI